MSGYERMMKFQAEEIALNKAVENMESYKRLLSCGGRENNEAVDAVVRDIAELKKQFAEYFPEA